MLRLDIPVGAATPLRNCGQEATEVIAEGRLTEVQAKELFDKVDADKSGVIEYGEFKQVGTPTSRYRATTIMRE